MLHKFLYIKFLYESNDKRENVFRCSMSLQCRITYEILNSIFTTYPTALSYVQIEIMLCKFTYLDKKVFVRCETHEPCHSNQL